jgi:hypothetical protein
MEEIVLYYTKGHYDVITSKPGFFKSSYYCESCAKPFQDERRHHCKGRCTKCARYKEECLPVSRQTCTKCLRSFENKECFDLHAKPGKHVVVPVMRFLSASSVVLL